LDKLNRQIAVLNEFANTLSKPAPAGNNQNSSGPLINSKESVDNFLNFIDSYSEKFDALSEKKHALEKEIKKLDEQIRVTRENLDRLQYSNYTENMYVLKTLHQLKYKFNSNLIKYN
jgi:cell division protein FtsB